MRFLKECRATSVDSIGGKLGSLQDFVLWKDVPSGIRDRAISQSLGTGSQQNGDKIKLARRLKYAIGWNSRYERTQARIYSGSGLSNCRRSSAVLKLNVVHLPPADSFSLTLQHEQVRNTGHGPGGRWQGVRETIPIHKVEAF